MGKPRMVRKDGDIVPFEICRYPAICTHGASLQTDNNRLRKALEAINGEFFESLKSSHDAAALCVHLNRIAALTEEAQ